jgi:hypothetical protein
VITQPVQPIYWQLHQPGVLPIVCPGLSQIVHTGDTIRIDRDAGQIIAGDHTFAIPRLRRPCRRFSTRAGWCRCFSAASKRRLPLKEQAIHRKRPEGRWPHPEPRVFSALPVLSGERKTQR